MYRTAVGDRNLYHRKIRVNFFAFKKKYGGKPIRKYIYIYDWFLKCYFFFNLCFSMLIWIFGFWLQGVNGGGFDVRLWF